MSLAQVVGVPPFVGDAETLMMVTLYMGARPEKRSAMVAECHFPFIKVEAANATAVCEVVDVDASNCDVPPAVLMRAAIALQREPQANAAIIGVRSRPCQMVAVYHFPREPLNDIGATLTDYPSQGKQLSSRINGARL